MYQLQPIEIDWRLRAISQTTQITQTHIMACRLFYHQTIRLILTGPLLVRPLGWNFREIWISLQ